MALLMTVFFENGFSENYFPNVDNRNFPIAIRPYVSGLKEELVLNAEVWDGQWKLRRSPQYSLILKGDPVESADLKDGTVIEGMVTKTDLYFSVKIDQVQREHVNFEKYMLKEGSIFKLEIGSDDLCNIVYKNRFVTGSHAEITFESGAAYITDKNSVNGTFLNGRLVREKTKLHYGDIIYVVGLKIVYLNNLLAINNPNNQCRIRELKAVEIPHFEDEPSEETEVEDVYFLRTPRKLLNLDRETISIEKCPKKQQQKRQPLIFTIGPSFTMVIPIALAAAMTSDGFGAGSICMSLGAAGIGAIWAVVNSAYNKKEEKVLPHYVVFISDISMIEGEPVSKYLLDPPKNAGVSVIFSADAIDKLPSHCNTIVQWEKDYSGCYNTLSKFEEREGVAFDRVSLAEMDVFSRQLSNFKVRENASNAAIPDMLTFLDMYKTSRVEDLDMYHKWLENRTYESMRSLIGQKAGEQPVYLDIHEKYHGPHGLVAGTTGSGKSETLQTYILSLVLNYHPHEVAFILIDYKGGGMAQSFIGLPHLAGVITNLGGNQTTRALLSINAEIKRRQRIFNEYKIKHIDAYIELYRNGEAEEPMPHLLIIADEFAELKKEQPEFVRALVSAARVGRSLGINLILATQKPSGVVDDEIWSNTRFRICLRVADKQDSNEMLKRTDAAYITGTGRGFLQVGNDEIFDEFQSGWSGAPYTPEIPFSDDSKAKAMIIGLTGKPEAVKKKKKKKGDNVKKFTQLDAMVQYAAKLAEENHIKPLRQIWLPPLPKLLYLEDMKLTWDEKQMKLPIGLADDPQNQRQFPVYLDFIRDGHLLICGSAGSGKTSLVQTIFYGAALHYTAKQVNFYIADFSSRTMTAFAGLPHTGCICMEGDDEKIQQMMGFAEEELDSRKKSFSQKGMGSYRDYRESYSDVPAIFLVIDNYPAFSDSYEQYESTLIQLSREGASYGIYLILTCNNSGDIRSRILQNITKGIGLQLADRFEYDSVIGMRSEILPDDRTTGRGLIKEGVPLEFQAALPVKASQGESMMLAIREKLKALTEEGTQGARKLGVQLDEINADTFLEMIHLKGLAEENFVMGAEDGSLISTDLDKTLCFTVCGAGKKGKTNFLKYTALLMKKKGAEVYVFDGCLRELEEFSRNNDLDGYMTDKEELYHFMENELLPQLGERNELVYEARQAKTSVKEALKNYKRMVLLINSASEFMEAVYSEDFDVSEVLETVFEKGMNHRLHFFMALSPREYEELAGYRAIRQFGDWKQGIHLGGAFDEQGIFDYEITPSERSRTYPAGAAFTGQEGRAVLFMTPFVKEGEHE